VGVVENPIKETSAQERGEAKGEHSKKRKEQQRSTKGGGDEQIPRGKGKSAISGESGLWPAERVRHGAGWNPGGGKGAAGITKKKRILSGRKWRSEQGTSPKQMLKTH